MVVSLLESIGVLLVLFAALSIGVVLAIGFAVLGAACSAIDGPATLGLSGEEFWRAFSIGFWIGITIWLVGYYFLFPIVYGLFKASGVHEAHLHGAWPEPPPEGSLE